LTSGDGYGVFNIANDAAAGKEYDFVKFTGGIGGTVTVLKSFTIASGQNWATFKISYNPTTNLWTYNYKDEASTTAYTDPSAATYTTTGTVTDNTYTGSTMSVFGFAVNSSTTSYSFYFDNFKCTVSPIINATSSSLTFENVTTGSTSAAQTVTVSGTALSADITVTAPSGFSVSSDGITYGSTATVAQTSGTASGTVYVKFAPTSAAGTVSGNVACTSTGATEKDIAVSGVSLAVEPTTSSSITFGDVTASTAVVNFSGGGGSNKIVLVHSGSAVDSNPVDATAYTASSVYGSGTQIGTGNYVVYNGTGSSVTVTGLTLGVTYYFSVYDYNVGTSTSQNYFATAGTNSAATSAVPTITLGSATLSFGNQEIASASSAQSYTITGSYLTSYPGDITITAPTGFQVSTSSTSGFASSITVPYTSSDLASTTIYVNFVPATVAAFSANITNAGGGASTQNVAVTGTGLDHPTITLASVAVAAGSIGQSSTKNALYAFTLGVSSSTAAAVLNTVNFTTSGTATTSDLSKFQLYYSTSNSLSGATQIGSDITTTSASAHAFTGLTQSIASGATGYFWITTDVLSGATANATVAVAAVANTDIATATGTITGTTSAGGTQAIVIPSTATDYFQSAASGLWSSAATWLSSSDNSTWHGATLAPTSSATSVEILSGHVITISTASTTIGATTVDNGGTLLLSGSGTVTVATSKALTVNGTFENNTALTTAITSTGTISFSSTGIFNLTGNGGQIPAATWDAASIINVTGLTSSGTLTNTASSTYGNYVFNSALTTGTTAILSTVAGISIQGSLTVNSTGAGQFQLFSSSGTNFLHVAGDYIQHGGTVILNPSSGSTTYRPMVVMGNFTIDNNASTPTFTLGYNSSVANLIVKGNVSLTNATIQHSAASAAGVANIYFAGSNQTFTASGATVTVGTGSSVNFFANSGTTLDLGTNVISGSTFTTNGVYTYSAFTGTTTSGGNSIASISSTAGLQPGMVITGTGLQANTVITALNWGGSSTTIGISKPATAAGTATTFTVSSASAATLKTANTAGVNGSITSTTKTLNAATNYEFNGSSAQVTGSSLTAAGNLTVNNSAGVTLSGATAVSGTLTLGSNNITTGSYALTANTISRTSGFVVGNLSKTFAAGSSVAQTFEIGSGSLYIPTTVTFATVSTGGTLTVSTTGSDHASIATSGVDASKSLNRYWTLSNSGIAFDSYSAALSYDASDVDAAATPANFVAKKYSGSVWSPLTVSGTPTSTGATITGATSIGDIILGDAGICTITASANTGGTITPSGSVSVFNGSDTTFTIAANAHYQIDSVVVDGTNLGAVASHTFTNVTAAHAINAYFSLVKYTITASAGTGGSITPSADVTYGTDTTFTITPSTGYQITDVLVDGLSVGAVTSHTFTNVTATHTISATFAKLSYTIAATAAAGGTITPSGSVSVFYGSDTTFTIGVTAGYSADSVVVDGVNKGMISSYTFTNITSAHSIAAYFTAGKNTITATATSGGTISPSGLIGVSYGTDTTFTIAANVGHQLDSVVVDGANLGVIASHTFTNVTAAHAINAYFSPVKYTITATAAAGGTITPTSANVAYGTDTTFTITANTGYQIDSLVVDGVKESAAATYKFTNVTAAHAINAYFSLGKNTITATTGTGGTISPSGSVSITYGTDTTFTIAASSGYRIDSVTVDGVSKGAVSTYTFTNVTGSHTISAFFRVQFTVSITSAHGSVVVTPTAAAYDSAAVVSLTATPSAGYYFKSWTGSITSTSNPYTADTLRANQTITAVYAAYVISNGTGGGDWNTTTTWTGGVIPVVTDSVIVLGTDSVGLSAAGTCLNLKLAAGAKLGLCNSTASLPGSSWNFDSLSTITFTGPTTVPAGPVYGSIVYASTSAGSPSGNLTVKNNFNITANVFRGISATSGSVTINVGHNVVVGPGTGAIISAVNSSAATTASCTWNIGGSLSLTGNNSGNYMVLYQSAGPHTGSVVYNIGGDLQIGTTVGSASRIQFKSSSSTTNDFPEGVINLKGNLIQNGTIGTSSVTSGTSPGLTVNFIGTSAQTYSGTGSTAAAGTFPITYNINNAAGVTLGSPRTFSKNVVLKLTNGMLTTSSTNLLTMKFGTASGGSASSFVNGPMIQTVGTTSTTALTYPIGKQSAYRPVVLSINQATLDTTTYSVEMFNGVPASKTLPVSLLSVSPTRYYTVTKGSGASLSPTQGATIKLSYASDDSVLSATYARVATSSDTAWQNAGGSGSADTTGTITSNAFFSLSTNTFVTAKADPSIPVTIPVMNTMAPSYISTTFASTGGNITSDGGAVVSARGVCWSPSGIPTITGTDSTKSGGAGSGVFTVTVKNMTANTKYYLRSYATNYVGTAYGNLDSIQTLAAVVAPTVTTTAVSSILVATATGGGTVTLWGGDTVKTRGVCWNTTGTPTTGDKYSTNGTDIGSFTSSMAPLTGSTKYYVRAFAINSGGTGYGDEVTFTTQAAAPDTTVIVDKNGTVGVTCDYTTLGAAFRSVPAGYTGNWHIYVKKGVYYEIDTLASGKINVTLEGESRDSTIITSDNYADRSGGTSNAFTVAIDANDFIAKNITLQNTYWPNRYGTATGTQGVALRTQGDRHQYINCRLLGYQDTYYTWGGSGTGRMYHKNCYIEGTVDFIFGRNICVFDSCTLSEIQSTASITAGGTDATSLYGYVFRNCTIRTDSASVQDTVGYSNGGAVSTFYLGRPWQGSPRVVYMHCSEPATLATAGWQSWNVTPALYAEFNCFGDGSGTSSRVISSQLTTTAASNYTLKNIFAKASATSSLITYDWIPSLATSADSLPISTSVGGSASLLAPVKMTLGNYPNPFNPSTKIQFSVEKSGNAVVRVYNLIGQEIAKLYDSPVKAGQYYTVTFGGSKFASGVYFYTLESNGQHLVQKMLMLK
jgi:hypothetical protein